MVLTEARPAAPEAASPGTGAWRWIVLTLVVVIGLGATFITGQQAEDEARERQRSLAVQAAVLVDGTAESSVAAVAGAGGLVTADGAVELDSFGTYAREVVAISPINVLAFEPVITADERAAFEEQIDGPILDQRGGELVPAPDRPLYYPVRAVVPETSATRPVIGFDLLADPERGPAALEARDTGRTVLTPPVRATSSGAVSFFLVKPLYRPGGPLETVAERREAHVGFVTTVYAGTDLADVVRRLAPGREPLHGQRRRRGARRHRGPAVRGCPSRGRGRRTTVDGGGAGRPRRRSGPGARRSRRSPSCWWLGSCCSSAGRGPMTRPPAGRPA